MRVAFTEWIHYPMYLPAAHGAPKTQRRCGVFAIAIAIGNRSS